MPEIDTRDRARITVTVRGTVYDGWLQSDVTRDLEAITGTFSIPVSLVPGQAPAINRQDAVQVRIGETVVINGFVLSAEPFYNLTDCGLRVIGRDRAGDLVHCSAVHKGGQWRGAALDRIVKDLLAPFGLSVRSDTDLGAVIQDYKLRHGETVLDAISRAARLRGVMVTRDDNGQVLLTRAGTKVFDAAIVRGGNVISMEGVGTDENRHSHYIAYGQCNTVDDFESARGLKAQAVDDAMKRYLPLVINADGNTTATEIKTLVDHTLRVRRGHSMGFRYTVEGWTVNGKAWPLNQLVTIRDDIAGLADQKWLICSVRNTCDLKNGAVTELLVRPPEAYDTQPLQTRVRRRNWGNKGNTWNHKRGPTDGAMD